LREWVTDVSSDELEGRAVFTARFGLAAASIEDHLRAWAPREHRTELGGGRGKGVPIIFFTTGL
jgi:hypothetical protein